MEKKNEPNEEANEKGSKEANGRPHKEATPGANKREEEEKEEDEEEREENNAREMSEFWIRQVPRRASIIHRLSMRKR